MHEGFWIALAVVVVCAVVATVRARRRRAEELAMADAPSRRERRAARREALEPRELHRLSPSQRSRYLDGWRDVEAAFADDPEAGIALADHATQQLAAELGYPVSSFHALAAALALDFPDEIASFCAAHAIALANERRAIPHRRLRSALRGYRALFLRLTGPVRFTGEEAERPFEMHETKRRR